MRPFRARAETVGATIDAMYDKLDGTETAVSAALVHAVAARLAPVIDAMNGARPDWLPCYRARILDGNHLPGPSTGSRSCGRSAPGLARSCVGRARPPADVGHPDVGPVRRRVLRKNGRCWTQVLGIVARTISGSPTATSATTDFLFGIAQRGGCLCDPTTCLDASLGVRRQAARLRSDRHRQGLRADESGPPTARARS